MTIATPTTKACTKCGDTKPLEAFRPQKGCLYGHRSSCRACDSKRQSEHRRKVRAAPKRVPAEKRCPGCETTKPSGGFHRRGVNTDGLGDYCKACVKTTGAYYRAQSPEKDSITSRAWREQNPDRNREIKREWARRNPHKMAARLRRRRARKREQVHPFANHGLIDRIYAHCPEGHHVDHIIPVGRGGMHHESNLQYLPAEENVLKNDRFEDELAFETHPIDWPSVIGCENASIAAVEAVLTGQGSASGGEADASGDEGTE